jgi:hypothetical protein
MNIFRPKDRQALQSQQQNSDFKNKSDLKMGSKVEQVEPVEIVEENKGGNKYILPIAIGVGVISIVAIIYLLRRKK